MSLVRLYVPRFNVARYLGISFMEDGSGSHSLKVTRTRIRRRVSVAGGEYL